MLRLTKRNREELRDPEGTRERLLQAGFQEIYRSGFQSAGIDTILAATNVTKGALYYHFESKEALGYAIVEEIIAKLIHDRWLRPLLGNGPDHRHFDRHCPADTSSARGRSRRLSAAQFGAGDVSVGRTIPQTAGEDIPLRGRKELLRFCERGSHREQFAAT